MNNDSPPLAMPTALTDAELIAAFLATDGEPGDPLADALLAEIERRGLDV